MRAEQAQRRHYLALGASYEGLNDGTPLVVEQVHLVHDEQAHRRRCGHISALRWQPCMKKVWLHVDNS